MLSNISFGVYFRKALSNWTWPRGVTRILNLIFRRGRVTIILNFALKINGGGREGGTCEVLDPATPPKKIWNVHLFIFQLSLNKILRSRLWSKWTQTDWSKLRKKFEKLTRANCESILTYMVYQNKGIDKKIWFWPAHYFTVLFISLD